MAPKKSTIVLNVEKFISDVEQRPAIWNRNFHCNKAFLEQMWDELSSQHKLPKVILKAKWKGLRDNFRVEYKRIPRADNGDFLVEPPTFESKWIHYYALLFLSEVYVLDDGGEVDLDLGNYERFMDITLHRDNNITTGKIYKLVIEKERTGAYLGKTVQVVPHITDAVQEWVERVAQCPVSGTAEPQVCIVELGGTIGDIEGMPFVEAFRQFQFRVKRENFCVAHVSLVPSPRTTGEPKTKPTQSSVRELRGFGLSPDLIVCRSEKPIGQEVKEKISNFCHVAPDQVICIHDLNSIYHVPLVMEQNGVIEFLDERLQLNIDKSKRIKCLQQWKDLARRSETVRKEVNIAIVGKYTKLEDAYASVVKALQHASLAVNYKLILKFIEACHLESATRDKNPSQYHEAWQALCTSDGVIVPGGFGARGMEGKINACNWCRTKNKPFLGICLGLQAAVIEFARNVLLLEGVNSIEVDPNPKHPLVIDMPEHHTGKMGGTMRLGKRTTVFSDGPSTIKQLYGNPKTIEERHRHRYEVNPNYVKQLEEHGLRFVGYDTQKTRMEIIELAEHPYYVATQYHPEYLSRPLKPSPPFLGLILASVNRLQNYINRGCRLSPRQMSDASSDEEQEIISNKMKPLQINGKLYSPGVLKVNGFRPTGKTTDIGSSSSNNASDTKTPAAGTSELSKNVNGFISSKITNGTARNGINNSDSE